MPSDIAPSSHLLNLISTAVTPIVLISATAILLSNHTNKYNNISTQMRALTHEYRDRETSEKRRATLRRELNFYGRRIRAMWVASICLYAALLCFLITVLSLLVISATSLSRLGLIGEISLCAGLTLLFVTVICELVEVRLAVHTSQEEMFDVLNADP
jgi:hypothetical protein